MNMNSAFPSSDIAKAARYVVVALGGTAFFLAMVAVSVHGSRALGRGQLPFQRLFEYQAEKLSGPAAHTIFIGDSSLGNAIDARLWSTLSGRPAVNLALTGVYGYEAGYNFLDGALKNVRPKNVVLMFSADMMTRPLTERAFEATRHAGNMAWEQRGQRYLKEVFNFTELSNAATWLWRYATGPSSRPQPGDDLPIENDYVKQRPQRPEPHGALTIFQIKPDKIKYHALIGTLCKEKQINCLYLHGPLASPECEQSQPYFKLVADIFAPSKVKQVSIMPVCLQRNEVGDSVDHVLPALKSTFTRRYYEILKPYLVE